MDAPSPSAICRVCGSKQVQIAGVVEYFVGYAWTIFDCRACGCRYTRHESSVYNTLHQSGALTYYDEYRELASRAKVHFDCGDAVGLRAFLSRSTKYRFIIDEIEREPPNARLLEFGCSRGYLTSYFILQGRKVLGVDVAPEAVDSARNEFGDHFALTTSETIRAGAPYDVIYHVGMIGCVADPIGITRQLIALLRPGGKLLFNAPWRAACWGRDQLWFDSAPPPDLVTLYPSGFWRRQFAGEVLVREGIQMCTADRSFALALRSAIGRGWQQPRPRSMNWNLEAKAPGSAAHWASHQVERVIGKVANVTGIANLASLKPAEFGLYVKMKQSRSLEARTEGKGEPWHARAFVASPSAL
jgi:SAM-dependent methyltransferase